ncbi:MAG: hypothetical protein AAF572_00805 [Cyanobacteria bacterium P01_B01_bin.77]
MDEANNNEQSAPFSGELEFEDLEFLSDQQAEMMGGGWCIGGNGPGFGGNGPNGGPRPRRRKGRRRKGW